MIEIGLTDQLKLGWEIAHSDHLSPMSLESVYNLPAQIIYEGKFDTSNLYLRFKHGWETPHLSNSTREFLPFQKENETASTLLPLLSNSFYHLGSLAHQKIGPMPNGLFKEMRNPFMANFSKITWKVV